MSFYIFVGAPTGPDPRRAPPGPRGRAQGTAQGPGEGPGPRGGPHHGPGPDARAKRALDSSLIYMGDPGPGALSLPRNAWPLRPP